MSFFCAVISAKLLDHDHVGWLWKEAREEEKNVTFLCFISCDMMEMGKIVEAHEKILILRKSCGGEYFLMETLLLKHIACWSIFFCFLSFILFIKLKSIWPLFVVWHGILWRRRRMRQTLPVASFVIVGDRLGVYQWLGFFWWWWWWIATERGKNEDFLLLDLWREKKMTHSSS